MQFDEPELEYISENGTSTEDQAEEKTLQLSGEGDFLQIANVTVTDYLEGLTITAWVKPDYSQGSSEFTVVSKEKSFSLSINNNIQPEKIVKFSVFDGIKWTTIESTSIITEDWSFLSSTFDGETISIYVNGDKEGTKEIIGVPTLSVSGKLETTAVDSITSEEDIVIGASLTTKDQNSKPSNQFSGEIDDVLLYDYVLADEQIRAIYEQTKDLYAALVENLPSIEEILAQIVAEQSENAASTDSVELADVNATTVESVELADVTPTELLVAPTLSTTKETYLITEDAELQLEFYDEYDVLMQELEELEIAMALLEAEAEQILNEVESNLVVPTLEETSTISDVMYFIGKLFTIQKADAAQLDSDDQIKIEIAKAKEEIQKLKEKIDVIKNGSVLDEDELKDAKAQLRIVIDQLKVAAMNAKTKLKTAGDDLEKSADKIEKVGDVEAEISIQKGKWVGMDEIIETVIYGPDGNEINLDYEQIKLRDGKFLIKLLSDRDGKPGLYKIVTTLTKNGQSFVVESEFAWGVLAINTDKSIFLPNENAFIGMAVLDDQGKVVCDADVTLTITSPSGAKTTLSTANGGITISEECEVLGVTNLPDYYTEYSVSGVGSYTMDLTAITANGVKSVQDSFTVQSTVEFDVTRDGPTRVFPLVPYTMQFTINANQDYNGKITEYVPASFEITPQQGLKVTTSGDTKTLSWNVNLKKGETITLSYEFDAPDVYPEFYLLGPLEIGSFAEMRQWQIANDAPGVDTLPAVLIANANTHSIASVTTTGTAPGIVVLVEWLGTNTINLAGSSYNGVTLSSAVSQSVGSGLTQVNSEILYATGFAAQTATVTVDFSGTGGDSVRAAVQAIPLNNVDTSSFLDTTAVAATTSGTSSSINLSGAASGTIIIDSIMVPAGTAPTDDSSSTQTHSGQMGGENKVRLAGSYVDSATTTTVSWSSFTSGNFAHVVASFNEKPAGGTPHTRGPLTESIAVSDGTVSVYDGTVSIGVDTLPAVLIANTNTYSIASVTTTGTAPGIVVLVEWLGTNTINVGSSSYGATTLSSAVSQSVGSGLTQVNSEILYATGFAAQTATVTVDFSGTG
ncbi:MAG: hypothetical protein IIA81_04060, partial [Thaumarchaeota archaeon]|nr:hypothetical protein [Nitrososphaerota archaeon]